jgi:hypothetical protein
MFPERNQFWYLIVNDGVFMLGSKKNQYTF